MTEGDLTIALRQLRDDVRAGNGVSARAVDEVMKLRTELARHVVEDARDKANIKTDVHMLRQRMDQLQGAVDDVEETTEQIEARKRDSDRAKVEKTEKRIGAVVKWGASIAAGLIVVGCSTAVGYAARAFMQDLSKPAQAAGQR